MNDLHKIYDLDLTDKKIISILQEEPEISYADLGAKVGKAASSVHNRVKKMIDAGVIEKKISISPFKVGYTTIALLGLSVEPSKMNEIAKKISNLKKVQMVGTTTGDHDMVIQIVAKDEKSLWRFINEVIKPIPGVLSKMDVSSFIDFFKISEKIEFDD